MAVFQGLDVKATIVWSLRKFNESGTGSMSLECPTDLFEAKQILEDVPPVLSAWDEYRRRVSDDERDAAHLARPVHYKRRPNGIGYEVLPHLTQSDAGNVLEGELTT